MEFYNILKDKIEIPAQVFAKTNQINHGKCGSVYKYGNQCIKLYDQPMNMSWNRLPKTMYQKLKTIPNPSLVNITDILYKEKSDYVVEGYIMDYYEKNDDDILEYPTEYLLRNAHNFLEISANCSSKKIRLLDIRMPNVLITKNNIVLIDPDKWEIKNKLNYFELEKINSSILISLLDDIICQYLNKYHSKEMVAKKVSADAISRRLLKFSNSKKTEKILAKKLRHCKRPIDYLHKL